MSAEQQSEQRDAGATAIEVRGLTKSFRSRWSRRRVDAVRGIDLEVREGEIFGFLGPNGAGKTTTIKMLMGLIGPTAGEMRLFGGPADALSARARIGYLPEHPYFYDYLRAEEILDFYAKLFRIPRAVRRRRIDELLTRVGLGEARKRRLRHFSKGMLQRVGIASALVNEPDLVVLDEPLSGLDPIGRKEMRDIIVGLRDAGKTVFFSSHILSDIELVCDRVAIIDSGVLKAVGALDDLVDAERVTSEVVVTGLDGGDHLEKMAPGVVVERIGQYHRLTVDEKHANALLGAVLERGARVETVTRKRESLEELFMRAAVRPGDGG